MKTTNRERPPDGYDWTDVLLVRLAATVSRRHAKALAPTKLTPRSVAALLELRAHGAMRQQALGDVLHIDPSNLVGLLNDLESAGLATRRRDPDDRRRHIVEISKRGEKKFGDAARLIEGVADEVLASLDAGERRQLHDLLARVAKTALRGQDAAPPEQF